jgi:Fic family protein
MKEPRITPGHDLLQLIAEIDEFKGQWQDLKNQSPERLRQLRKVATIQSVGSSTRIEGARLSDAQVETLLSDVALAPFNTRDEQEVAGYAETMDVVFHAHEDMRLTESRIRQLHETLLKHSEKDATHRGEYKKVANQLVATDAQGNELGMVFETALPVDTPREMEELVRWAAKAIDERSLHPLLVIAVFVAEFLAIHPFKDGNGRLSRILTTLLLLRAGYAYVPFASLEHVIEENKDLYYKALRRTQLTLKSDSPDWEPWLAFFLRCLKKQKDHLAARVEREKTASDTSLATLSVAVLDLLKSHDRLTISQLAQLTGANRNTLKVRLRELVASHHIQRHGQGKSTWYRRAPPPS